MKHFSLIFIVMFFSSMSVFSQEKYTQHIVSKGETITKIAQQYNVKPSVIYEKNPNAENSLQPNSVLIIPTATSNYTVKIHSVLGNQTLYGISKYYGISIEDLYKMNPTLEKTGLRKGDVIKIPGVDFEKPSTESSKDSSKDLEKSELPENPTPNFENMFKVQPSARVGVA